MVPISICTSEDPSCTKIKVLLDQSETTVTIPNVAPDHWIKVRLLFVYFFMSVTLDEHVWPKVNGLASS